MTMTCMSVKFSILGNFINNNVIVYLHVGPKCNVGKYTIFQEFHHPIEHHICGSLMYCNKFVSENEKAVLSVT